ncbi:cytosine permease [Halopenitus persicus]|uniref:cytosine permease n=1 Tax=Halopenitus persicus TaxID=1048396 RepID=UPI000BBA7846|nr:cytosine permease [Halopenitus persicus]
MSGNNISHEETAEEAAGLSLKGKDIMPKSIEDRSISSFGFLLISVGLYVQLVSFVAGAQVYPALSPLMIIVTVIVGNLAVWVLLVLTGDIGLKHGIPFAVYIRAPFGYLGAHIPALVRALPAVFWFGFQTWLGATALNLIMETLTGYSNLMAIIVVFGLFQILNTALGIDAISKFDWVAAPILIITGIIMEVVLIQRYDLTFAELFSSSGEGGISFLSAVAIMAGAQITMAVNIADFTQFLKRPEGETSWVERNKGSAWAQLFGLVPPMAFFVIVGMTSGIATGEWNPIFVMADVFGGNTILLIFVLAAFVIFAQVASNTGQNLLPPGYVFVNLFPRRISFPTAVTAAGVVGLLIQPWEYADLVPTILLWISALLGPIVGIMIADYYAIRKRELNLDELYDANGQYTYWRNFNPAAMITYVISAGLGLLFPDLAFFVAMLVSIGLYYGLMKLWVLDIYPQSEVAPQPESATVSDD